MTEAHAVGERDRRYNSLTATQSATETFIPCWTWQTQLSEQPSRRVRHPACDCPQGSCLYQSPKERFVRPYRPRAPKKKELEKGQGRANKETPLGHQVHENGNEATHDETQQTRDAQRPRRRPGSRVLRAFRTRRQELADAHRYAVRKQAGRPDDQNLASFERGYRSASDDREGGDDTVDTAQNKGPEKRHSSFVLPAKKFCSRTKFTHDLHRV